MQILVSVWCQCQCPCRRMCRRMYAWVCYLWECRRRCMCIHIYVFKVHACKTAPLMAFIQLPPIRACSLTCVLSHVCSVHLSFLCSFTLQTNPFHTYIPASIETSFLSSFRSSVECPLSAPFWTFPSSQSSSTSVWAPFRFTLTARANWYIGIHASVCSVYVNNKASRRDLHRDKASNGFKTHNLGSGSKIVYFICM